MNSIKAQITVVEMGLLFLLFGTILGVLGMHFYEDDSNYISQVDSFLDMIYYSNQFRSLFMGEDLGSSAISEDWIDLGVLLNNSFGSGNYEVILSNLSNSKKIYSCESNYEKYYVERILSINNNTLFEFRMIRLGVCS